MSQPTNQSKKPANSRFKQQRLKAWQPILTPTWVIGTFFFVGIVFIPIGAVIIDASNKIVELTVPYSDHCSEKSGCKGGPNERTLCKCELNFTLSEEMKPPVYVYYQLENYYQNHRRYVKSRSDRQLRGDFGDTTNDDKSLTDALKGLTDCEPDTSLEYFTPGGADNVPAGQKLYYYPCGLIARSLFNDTFQLIGGPDNLDSGAPQDWATGRIPRQPVTNKRIKDTSLWTDDKIAWESDIKEKFKSKSFKWLQTFCRNDHFKTFEADGQVFKNGTAAESDQRKYYCTHDVTDPDFIVWMRTAGLPTFKKLHRIINNMSLRPGNYMLWINDIYDVSNFEGKKSVVFSTTSWIGGRNMFLGTAYIVVGSLCVLLGLLFLIKHVHQPRKLGDDSYLEFKN